MEMDGGGYTTLQMHLMPLNCTLTVVMVAQIYEYTESHWIVHFKNGGTVYKLNILLKLLKQ